MLGAQVTFAMKPQVKYNCKNTDEHPISTHDGHRRRADLLQPGSTDIQEVLLHVEAALSAKCLVADLTGHQGKVHDLTFNEVLAVHTSTRFRPTIYMVRS